MSRNRKGYSKAMDRFRYRRTKSHIFHSRIVFASSRSCVRPGFAAIFGLLPPPSPQSRTATPRGMRHTKRRDAMRTATKAFIKQLAQLVFDHPNERRTRARRSAG